MTRIWIGQRESDILTVNNYYDKSITFYGSNLGDNYSFCTECRLNAYYDESYFQFVFGKLEEILKEDPDIEVHFYSGPQAHRLLNLRPDFAPYFKYINDEMLLDWLNNKTYTRLWMENSVSVPKYALLSKAQCSYDDLARRFPEFDEFILQQNHSSGGKGTFKMNKVNGHKVFEEIPSNEPLLVSPYYANTISANCHMVIGANESILFQTSAQIINVQNDRMIYSGGDFAFGRKVDEMMGEKLYRYKADIANHMSKAGYRGVCGIDYLIYGDDILLIEINPRYQGSTFLVNHTLLSHGYPHVSELTVSAFDDTGLIEEWKDKIEKLEIKLEGHVVSLSPDTTIDQAYDLLDTVKNGSHVVFLDGFLEATRFESNPYLFKYF